MDGANFLTVLGKGKTNEKKIVKEIINSASKTNSYKDFLSHTLQVLPTPKLHKAFSSW